MKRAWFWFLIPALGALLALGAAAGGCAPAEAPPAPAPAAPAAPPEPPFYEGKTIRVIVGLAPGGGYDLFARLVAKHIGKHIPGKPSVLVENMPGAASLISANHLYKVAKPDGLTLGVIGPWLVMTQMVGDPAMEFDLRKFNWIGAPSTDNFACLLRADRGIKTFEEWLRSPKEMVMGGVSPDAPTDYYAKALQVTLGVPLRVVTGYGGTAPVRRAIDAGEVDGYCNAWESLRTTHAEALQTGFIIPLVQVRRAKEAPNVPLMEDLAKTPEAKQIFRLVSAPDKFTRPWVAPPGVPEDRLKLLRQAFGAALKDPELLAEAEKAKFEITHVSAEEVEKLIKEALASPPEVVKQLAPLIK